MLAVAPLSNLLGGLLLITAWATPDTTESSRPGEKDSVRVEPVEPLDLTWYQRALSGLAEIQDELEQAGWTLSAIGLTGGKYNIVSSGYRSKQPSMVAGGLLGMGLASYLMIDPAVSVRIGFLLASGLLISGFANKMQNEYQLKPGETPRQFDMSVLLHPSRLQPGHDAPNNTATLPDYAVAWARELGKAGVFIAQDQANVFRMSIQKLGQRAAHPVTSLQDTRRAFKHLVRYWRKQEQELPKFAQPNALQNQAGAMLINLGGLTYFISAGPKPMMESMGKALIATGSTTADTSFLAEGANQKGFANKALFVGTLTYNASIPFIHSLLGMGVNLVSVSTMDWYFARDAARDLDEKRRSTSKDETPTD